MSAQPRDAVPDTVSIEIDGRQMDVAKGSMIIEAADNVGIPIPRFCYHRKLAIAANCRMCLVEVEKMGKPAPACATPVSDGMKVFTRSDKALRAQRNVMEFLLINHPLDCPICDQGGECELQDIALGYGRSVSRFTERKRVVADENLGPLIATDMTRCIQCTRCVRFLGEIAGTYELGGLSRGEHLEIGTYIGKTIESELSGNVIDVCPVGALTDKVYRFKARAWEMIARPSLGYHDAMGSNLWLHMLRGRTLRTVPRDAEAVNECWLSDRDRYSHEGLYADDRAESPLIKRDGEWQQVEWDEALALVAERLGQQAAGDIGMLVQAATSCEEGALLARIARGLKAHIDHRLRQCDLADGAVTAAFEMRIADLERADAALLVGADLRSEMPLLNHRLRKAHRHGAKVHAIAPLRFESHFQVDGETIVAPQRWLDALLGIAGAASEDARPGDARLAQALEDAEADAGGRAAVEALAGASAGVVIFGQSAAMHPQASWLRATARFIARATGSAFNEIPMGANTVGLTRAGVLPEKDGLDACGMLEQPRKAYVLYGTEPPLDFADGAACLEALKAAEFNVAFSAFASEALKEVADVILPIGLLPEIDATLVNVDGDVQTVAAGSRMPEGARPGWKALRALGAMLDIADFDFTEIAELRAEIESPIKHAKSDAVSVLGDRKPMPDAGLVRIGTLPIYRVDAVVRRAKSLQAHPLNLGVAVSLNPDDARAVDLADGDRARVAEGAVLSVRVDDAVAPGTAWIPAAFDETALLPPYGASFSLSKA